MNTDIALVTYLPEKVNWAEFSEILRIKCPLYIWGPNKYKEEIYRKRNFLTINYYPLESGEDFSCHDKFEFLKIASQEREQNGISYFYWIDHDIFKEIKESLNNEEIFSKIGGDPFLLLSTGFGKADKDFPIDLFREVSRTKALSYWCFGHFFGGVFEMIQFFYDEYVKILSEIESRGEQVTEEFILTALRYLYADIINAHHIGGEGFSRFLNDLSEKEVILR